LIKYIDIKKIKFFGAALQAILYITSCCQWQQVFKTVHFYIIIIIQHCLQCCSNAEVRTAVRCTASAAFFLKKKLDMKMINFAQQHG
jgi:hypothetical protein